MPYHWFISDHVWCIGTCIYYGGWIFNKQRVSWFSANKVTRYTVHLLFLSCVIFMRKLFLLLLFPIFTFTFLSFGFPNQFFETYMSCRTMLDFCMLDGKICRGIGVQERQFTMEEYAPIGPHLSLDYIRRAQEQWYSFPSPRTPGPAYLWFTIYKVPYQFNQKLCC